MCTALAYVQYLLTLVLSSAAAAASRTANATMIASGKATNPAARMSRQDTLAALVAPWKLLRGGSGVRRRGRPTRTSAV